MTRYPFNKLGLWVSIIILLIGGGLRMTGIDFGLPYIRHNDEPNFYRLAQDMRGEFDAGYRETWLAGYPPGYIWEYRLILDFADLTGHNDINQHMARYVGFARIVNVLTDILTLALVMASARLLGGTLAGILAGAVYGVAATVIEHAAYALPDTPTTFFCALTMLLTIVAFKRSNWRWGIAAAVAGCLATIVKYPAAPVLVLPGMYFLWLLWKEGQRALIPAAVAAAIVAGTAYLLLVVNGGAHLGNIEAHNARNNFVVNMTNPARWEWAFNGLYGVVGRGILALGGLALLIVLWRRRAANAALLLLTCLGGLLIFGLIPAYLSDNPGAMYPTRYVQPAGVLFIVVLAALIAQTLLRPLKRLNLPNWIQGAQVIVVVVICVVGFKDEFFAYLKMVNGYISYQLAQAWINENIPDDGIIWTESGTIYTSLSRYDRGFTGYKEFQVWFAESLPIIKPEDKATIQYIYLRESDKENWSRTKGWESLDNFILLKHIHGDNVADQDIYIYRAKPMPNPQSAVFSSAGTRLMLRGIEVTATATRLAIDSYWEADMDKPEVDYSYTLYLTPAGAPTMVLAQRDGQLGNRPTSRWYDPEEIIQGELGALDLPADLPDGEYTLWLAVYYWETGERLLLADGTNALAVYTLAK